jgi:hypothetical protein
MRESFRLAHFSRDGEASRNYELTKREFEALERTLLRLRPATPMVINPLPRRKERGSAEVFKHMEGHRQIDTAAFAYCLHVARAVYERFPELVVSETVTRGLTTALRHWHDGVKKTFDTDALQMAQESILRPDYEERLRSQAEQAELDERQSIGARNVR